MENTIFREAFGNSPKLRILETLIIGRELDWSLTDIAEQSNVGWSTLHRIFDSMIKSEIIKFNRTIGKAKLYRINQNNKIAKELIRIFDLLIKEETEMAVKNIELTA
ncbi:hypothetical protein HYX16_04965 [Candidatus Woesearchaeota archaeon]|nr:hypothetical protein [Candidatus Woesearchaeota archaeon]